jgi:hypothetical protein
MKKNIYVIFVFLIVICTALSLCGKPHTKLKHSELKVIFIRHGEKPENGNNLSCKGLNRSLQLPAIVESKFGIPDFLYVPSLKMAKKNKQARMYETVVPMAVKYNLDINSEFDENDSTGIANDILVKKGTVLVVWEHKAINSILHSLGIYSSSKWKDDDFNTILIVTYVKGQVILTKDTENLNPSDNCP